MDFFNGFMRIVQMNDTNACYSDITCTRFFVMPLSVAKYIVFSSLAQLVVSVVIDGVWRR